MRVVLDASACVEFLLGTQVGARVADVLTSAESVAAPELLVSEVTSALRGLVRGGQITDDEGLRALRRLVQLDVELLSALPAVERIWRLADRHSSYGAHYVALAQAFGATLVTCDAGLGRAASSTVGVVGVTLD